MRRKPAHRAPVRQRCRSSHRHELIRSKSRLQPRKTQSAANGADRAGQDAIELRSADDLVARVPRDDCDLVLRSAGLSQAPRSGTSESCDEFAGRTISESFVRVNLVIGVIQADSCRMTVCASGRRRRSSPGASRSCARTVEHRNASEPLPEPRRGAKRAQSRGRSPQDRGDLERSSGRRASLVVPSDHRRRHCGRRPVADVLLPSMSGGLVRGSAYARSASRRVHLKPDPVALMPAVLAIRSYARLEMLTAERARFV